MLLRKLKRHCAKKKKIKSKPVAVLRLSVTVPSGILYAACQCHTQCPFLSTGIRGDRINDSTYF